MNGFEPNDPHPAGTKRSRRFRRLLAFGKWIAEREQLPDVETGIPDRPAGRSVIDWLTSADSLPDRRPSGPNSRTMLFWLGSQDPLPSQPQRSRRRSGFFSWLASRERLPADAAHNTPKPQSFLRWLLTSKSLERPSAHESPKEVPFDEP